jgi:hypothetical protein
VVLEDAVYPQTPDVVDGLKFAYTSPSDNDSEWGGRVRAQVKDGNGKVVDRLGLEDSGSFTCVLPPEESGYCGVKWNWTARHDGLPLPPGIYRLTVIQRDRAGNRTQAGAWVRVSGASLVAVQTTVTVAADLGGWCNVDCGEFQNCGQVVQPGRFGPGSLSYRSADDCPHDPPFASSSQGLEFDPDVAALGSFRVTAYGGPTTPGASDQGELLVEYPDFAPTSTGTDTSDHETTSQWAPIDGRYGAGPSISWSFQTRGTNSYDVAWFRVEYVVYQPPA